MFVSSTFKVNQHMSRRYLSPRRPLSRLTVRASTVAQKGRTLQVVQDQPAACP